MLWTDIKYQWDQFVLQLTHRFPELDAGDLIGADGSQEVVAVSLAKAHDLTETEALEALDDWRLVEA
ncbi:MAG: hypothetical protein KJN93_07600 [Alphaproteobacteria bacterium]|nr:hypothetical protein [Alphaproteobacteria bacterium]NNF25252.1 hypothetical protein [Paracoccaceae bacterium]